MRGRCCRSNLTRSTHDCNNQVTQVVVDSEAACDSAFDNCRSACGKSREVDTPARLAQATNDAVGAMRDRWSLTQNQMVATESLHNGMKAREHGRFETRVQSIRKSEFRTHLH